MGTLLSDASPWAKWRPQHERGMKTIMLSFGLSSWQRPIFLLLSWLCTKYCSVRGVFVRTVILHKKPRGKTSFAEPGRQIREFCSWRDLDRLECTLCSQFCEKLARRRAAQRRSPRRQLANDSEHLSVVVLVVFRQHLPCNRNPAAMEHAIVHLEREICCLILALFNTLLVLIRKRHIIECRRIAFNHG